MFSSLQYNLPPAIDMPPRLTAHYELSYLPPGVKIEEFIDLACGGKFDVGQEASKTLPPLTEVAAVKSEYKIMMSS